MNSLCTLNGNRLLSGSADCSIKIWIISDKDLAQIKKIPTSAVYKVIPLSKQRFASCSLNYTVDIWRDNNTYECLSTLEHDNWVTSILPLRNTKILVSSIYHSSFFSMCVK